MKSWFKSAIAPMDIVVSKTMRRYTAQSLKQKDGAQAEHLAGNYLIDQGMSLLDANVACMRGEIDLIMLDGKILVFVEVRWRKTAAYGGALASVTKRKLGRLTTACEMFLQYNPNWRLSPCRIDVVLLQGDLSRPKITWLCNVTG